MKTTRVSYDPNDIPKITRLVETFGEACGLRKKFGPLARKTFIHYWTAMLSAKTAFLVLLEDDGVPVGAMGILVAPSTYWDRWSANETFWYVDEDSRTGTAPVRMLRVAETEAKSLGCSIFFAGHKTEFNHDVMERLYKKFGYEPLEKIYVKEI